MNSSRHAHARLCRRPAQRRWTSSVDDDVDGDGADGALLVQCRTRRWRRWDGQAGRLIGRIKKCKNGPEGRMDVGVDGSGGKGGGVVETYTYTNIHTCI
jgi:hypothetical protein